MNAARPLEMQIREWLSSKEQQQVSNLATAEADAAATHLWILAMLQGIDPADLATVTQGRVTCPEEHRDTLRDLIARPLALEPGMVLPWRVVGALAASLNWIQRTPAPAGRTAWSDALGSALITTFLATAQRHVHTAAWRWHISHADELKALAGADAAQLVRLGLQSRLGLVFSPPDAAEQDCARRIHATERGFQRLAEAKLRTRSRDAVAPKKKPREASRGRSANHEAGDSITGGAILRHIERRSNSGSVSTPCPITP